MDPTVVIDRNRLVELIARERDAHAERNPRSRALFDRTSRSLLGGVPMSWMTKWAGGFPLFFAEAHGACVTDVDGNVYVDFCLGDTGAMAGHAPEATAVAVERQIRRGTTTCSPARTRPGWGRSFSVGSVSPPGSSR